jgi:putative ABC transport system permease protein
MGFLRGIAAHLRGLVRHGTTDRELDDEIRFHIERETEKNVRLGMAPEQARRRALADFGGVRRVKEEHRDVRGVTHVEELGKDVRFALRTLRRAPALTVAAIVTLALGVGANTAIFSVVNAVILRPLPFPNAERLVMLWEENPDRGWYKQTAAPANVLDWRAQVPAFQDVAFYSDGTGTSTLAGEGGAPQIIVDVNVSGNFFSVLGVRAERGRSFTYEETWATGTNVVIISHRLWQTRFSGSADVVGRTVHLDGRQVQIVGVMPASFAFPSEGVDAWNPLGLSPTAREQVWFRRAHWQRVIARIKPGVSHEQANTQLQQVVRRLQEKYPETNTHMGAGMTPLHEFLVGDTRRPLLVLLGAVGLLLLIACANVGNLMLVQAAGREREVALRLALGAGRGRVVRQALTESLVLSAIGGAAGLLVGWLGTRVLVAMQPRGLLRVSEVSPDWRVLLYILVITTASGLLFGIAPALWTSRRIPSEALKDGGRGGSQGRRMRRWGDALAIGEVALSLLLMVGAGLLVRSFLQLRNVNPGFDATGVLAGRIDLPQGKYDTDAKSSVFQAEFLKRVRALPGVTAAAFVSPLPLTGGGWTSDVTAEGRRPGDHGVELVHRRVSPGYFKTMRVPLIRGRDFTDADQATSGNVIVINEAFAKSYFRGQDPIGKRVAFDRNPDSTSTWNTIVGIVGNEHQETLALESRPEAIGVLPQDGTNNAVLVVRTTGDPAALTPSVKRVLADVDPGVAFGSPGTMEGIRAASLAKERFMMTLLLVFAGVGLVLAVVGVYGVLAQIARRRVREMGIRIALGAQEAQVRWMIVRYGLRLAITGLVLGGVAGLLATRSLQSMLFQVPAADPVTFIGVGLLLATTSAVASWLPALRASKADPASALRSE